LLPVYELREQEELCRGTELHEKGTLSRQHLLENLLSTDSTPQGSGVLRDGFIIGA